MNIPLKNSDKMVIRQAEDLYRIMLMILQRERKPDRTQEHFWTISLSLSQTLLSLELVSLGGSNKVLIRPADVFSFPLQKKAASVLLIHNHPSGRLAPSEEDKELTDRMIQVGRFMNTPVQDHLIITEHSYYSFLDSGLLEQLQAHPKVLLDFDEIEKQKNEIRKQSLQAGRLHGLKVGKSALLMFLKARGVPMTVAERRRIQTCKDVETLEKWVRNAADASSMAQVFDEGEANGTRTTGGA